MSNRIFCRSPFIIEINEALQTGSRIELFLSNTPSFTTLPTYTLSKLIPASNNLQTTYNVSPYIREFIKHSSFSNNWNVDSHVTPLNEHCHVKIKRYKLTGIVYTLISTTSYVAYDGFGLYEQGYNHDLGRFLLEQKTYNYYYNPNVTYGSNLLETAGIITLEGTVGHRIRYTELVTGNIYDYTLPATNTYDIYRVYPAAIALGNKVEYIIGLSTVIATWIFKPIEECRYTPLTIDFVNQYGGWQREFLFKASNDTISTENKEYNLLQSNLVNYSILEGQRKIFNSNAKISIKGNTGFVNEDFKSNLSQLMVSERILVNNKPAKLNTKSTELFKNINTKQINYQLEFEIANDYINNVV
jgi:hypothetical protein